MTSLTADLSKPWKIPLVNVDQIDEGRSLQCLVATFSFVFELWEETCRGRFAPPPSGRRLSDYQDAIKSFLSVPRRPGPSRCALSVVDKLLTNLRLSFLRDIFHGIFVQAGASFLQLFSLHTLRRNGGVDKSSLMFLVKQKKKLQKQPIAPNHHKLQTGIFNLVTWNDLELCI